ncbi:hypothetical protein TNIN_63291 [Trichonephila inaurata madagascariensis]|uniref:Uncharacterized protein n=1 Tax=Trichonephila inaurata madagascariensis TaxID=2747483 RepID=A0A8X7BXU1_9ARAC|nr:hypothetical protein TNIN_63291 [Trichonephila inaurata madagascariensis]
MSARDCVLVRNVNGHRYEQRTVPFRMNTLLHNMTAAFSSKSSKEMTSIFVRAVMNFSVNSGGDSRYNMVKLIRIKGK